MGPATIVVANAGVLVGGPLAELDLDTFERAFAVNARGTFLTFKEAAARLPHGGRIIGISTSLTVLGRPGVGAYAASKAAVEQLVKILARELGPRRITVNAIAPRVTDTDMPTEAAKEVGARSVPFGRIGRPDEQAEAVAFLASEAASWITGQIIRTNGGII